MSIMRKGFTAFLFLLLLVAARTAFAERSGEYRYRVLGDGTAEITECTSKSKLIEIPSELDGRVVSSLGDQSFYQLHNVEEIRVPDSIRRIGDYVFSNCYDLVRINVPDSVKEIGQNPFMRCEDLKEISISEFQPVLCRRDDVLFDRTGERLIYYPISSRQEEYVIPDGTVRIDGYAFSYTPGLLSVIIPDSVREIGEGAFYECTRIQHFDIPGSVEGIGKNAFYSCFSADFQLHEGLRRIGLYAFGYTKITEITLPDSVTEIDGNPFFLAEKLTEIRISPIHPYFEIRDNYLYDRVRNKIVCVLPTVTVERFDFPETTEIIGGGAFAGQYMLEEVHLPDTVREIGEDAFLYCSRLKTVDFSPNILRIGPRAFSETQIRYAILPEGLETLEDQVFQGCGSLVQVSIPSTVKTIGSYAFESCGLEEINLPSSLTSIGYGAFWRCKSLKNDVIVPDQVDSIGAYAFAECEQLESLHLPASLKEIPDYLAYECDLLDDVNLPEGITEIGKTAFCNIKISRVRVPDSVVRIERQAFIHCKELLSVELPANLRHIGEAAFQDCSSLSEIQLPEGLETLGNDAFMRCYSLRGLVMPDQIDSVGNRLLYNCSSLEFVHISASATYIGESAFQKCAVLSEVVIPDGVTGIGRSAFSECPKLTVITLPSSITDYEGIHNIPGGSVEYIVDQGSFAEEYCQRYNYSYRYSGKTAETASPVISPPPAETKTPAATETLAATETPIATETPKVTETPAADSEVSDPYVVDMSVSTFFMAYLLPDLTQTLYLEPSAGADSLTDLPGGTAVLVYEVRDSWAFVNANGYDGYLPVSSLTLDAPAPTQAAALLQETENTLEPALEPDQASTPGPVMETTAIPETTAVPDPAEEQTTEVRLAWTNIKNVNVRKEPTKKSTIVVQLKKKGTEVVVLDEVYDDQQVLWVHIRTEEGSEGYIRGDLLDLDW